MKKVSLACEMSLTTCFLLKDKSFVEDDVKWEKVVQEKTECLDPYTLEEFEQLGEAIVVSLVDMSGKNELSRIPSSSYKSFKVLHHDV